MKKYRSYAIVALVAAAVAIQFAPVERRNPRVSQEIKWDSPETEALARKACYDCHSNETVWPWYAWVAPASWRVAGHVADGKRHLNFSTWDQPNEDLDEIKKQLDSREMPLWDYRLFHPEARLTDEEYDKLMAGIRATYETDPAVRRRRPRGFGPEGRRDSTAFREGAIPDSAAVGMEDDDH